MQAVRDFQDRALKRSLQLSLVFHFVFILFVVTKNLVFPESSTPYIPALRVDIVGLPDLTPEELSKINVAPGLAEPAIEPEADVSADEAIHSAEEDELILSPKKAKTTPKPEKKIVKKDDSMEKARNALARIKALSRIQGEPTAKKRGPSVLIKGNQLSSGTSLSGQARETGISTYYDILREQIRTYWELPIWLSRQQLSAQVLVFIDQHGQIRSYYFQKPSGNSHFDEAVQAALKECQPLPPPPADLAQKVLTRGISMGFPL